MAENELQSELLKEGVSEVQSELLKEGANAVIEALPERQKQWVLRGLLLTNAGLVLMVLPGIAIALIVGAWPALAQFGPAFLTGEDWSVVTDQYGALGAVYGTLGTALIALLLAAPVGFGTAIFLSVLAPRWMRRPVSIAIDLAVAIPGIVYGLWGLLVLLPLVKRAGPWLIAHLGPLSWVGSLFRGPSSGYGVLSAGLLLAVMVLPLICAKLRDVFEAVCADLRESSPGPGASTWEVTRRVVAASRTGVLGAILLGLGVAFGEAVGVTLVIGSSHSIHASLLGPGTTLSASVMNELAEAEGTLHTSALFALGAILFFVTLPVICGARLLLCAGRAASAVQVAPVGASSGAPLSRRQVNFLALGLSGLAAVAAFTCLGSVLWSLFSYGLAGVSSALFTASTPLPGGRGGGLFNAFWGSAMMTGTGAGIAFPFAFLASYASDRERGGRLGALLRLAGDVLSYVPSVLIGLVVYETIVVPMHSFSGYAGAVALAVVALPVMMRMDKDNLRLLSQEMTGRRWAQLKSATMLLAAVCVAGETAPLLFTALDNPFWTQQMSRPTASLPVVLYFFAQSPDNNMRQLAWSGALALTVVILLANALVPWSIQKAMQQPLRRRVRSP